MSIPNKKIVLSARQRRILTRWANGRTVARHLGERARIILLSADGVSNKEQAVRLGDDVDVQRIRRWRNRWAAHATELGFADAQGGPDKDFSAKMTSVLSDAYRSGAPSTFSAQEVAQIMAVGLQEPEACGIPVSHWTPSELRREVLRRGIVESISSRQVGRFFKEADFKPQRSRYWLNPKDPERLSEQAKPVCDAYLEARELSVQGIHVVSTDEKTGMQALERIHPTKPTQPGLVERVEYEYKRHGTLCLMANFMVATGRIVTQSIGPTRTEKDFAANIERTIDSDPQAAGWTFVADQLDTHMSEALVLLVAERIGYTDELGVKGKSGILKSRETRKQFLTDAAHPIRFVYTPKHCSWLNQVEIWFSILSRRLLKRSSFTSLENLHERLLSFIEYFNAVLAKPFKWTYTGRILKT